MPNQSETLDGKVILITGAARRIGARIAQRLHAQGANIILHYRSSRAEADALRQELQRQRADSVALVNADLQATADLPRLIEDAVAAFGRLDALINNASAFYPTPIGAVSESQWDELLGINLKAPFFLSQTAAAQLRQCHGSIVNLVDVHAERPLQDHPVYSITKAGLVMMTKALAAELGPQVRVNAVAPGAILWPQNEPDETEKQQILQRTFLKRRGDPDDIAGAVLFLIRDAGYMTGQVLTIDGGRSLYA